MDEFVSVGKILNFHGIKGEVKVGCSQSDFIMNLEYIYLKKNNDYEPLKILSAKSNKKFLIMKFEGLDDINDIISIKGNLLYVKKSQIRQSLEDDEFLIDELVGLEVFDSKTNEKLGFVVGVSNNGATDLISVKTKSKKISLVPFVKAIVPIVDIKCKKIILNNMEGLLE